MTETATPFATLLPGRGLLRLDGEDVRGFLQGLVSNDTALLTPRHALFCALLTPQGKFLHELILADSGDGVLIDTEEARKADLQRRLTMYRLRAKIGIAAPDGQAVAVAFGDGVAARFGLSEDAGAARPLDGGGAVFVDPRKAALGVRLVGPRAAVEAALAAAGLVPEEGEAAWERHRLSLGVPDGSRDIAVDRGFLLENNFEELNGVSFTKGCYVGQELTARTKHRSTIRKKLMTVEFDPAAPPPPPDTTIMFGGRDAGAMRTAVPGVGLAMIRLEFLDPAEGEDHVFTADGLVIHPIPTTAA
ncbi:YgfZ/GcvT domain-containing protein [Zavarzinia aquatilis]|uniref:Folate-binding protein n=1 Tax=Zavarzinia aquatilis TaxID=2211142 RepID=A0A317ED70_9PROT|nr:folate-binding protein YgfZ [Zavarzinia aquatilis]PWR24681.1 folate-binding protein [Zavarzinia aquatilis]